jgi:hypothetical protein
VPDGWRVKASLAGGAEPDDPPLQSEAGDAYRHWMPAASSRSSSSFPSHPASARASPPPEGAAPGGATAVAAALAAVDVAAAVDAPPRVGGVRGAPLPRREAAPSHSGGSIDCQTEATSFSKPPPPILSSDLPPPKKAVPVKPPFACYGRGNSKPTHSSDMLASYNLNPLLHPTSEKEAVLSAGGARGHKVFNSALAKLNYDASAYNARALAARGVSVGSSAAFAPPSPGAEGGARFSTLAAGAEVEVHPAGEGRRDVATQRTAFQLEDALLSAAAAPGGGTAVLQLNLATLVMKSPALRKLEGARFGARGSAPDAGSLDAPPPSWKFKQAGIGRGAPAPFSPGPKPQAREEFLGASPTKARAAGGAAWAAGGGSGAKRGGGAGTPVAPPPAPPPRVTPGSARRGPPPPVTPSASPAPARAAERPPPPPPASAGGGPSPARPRPDTGSGARASLDWRKGGARSAASPPAVASPTALRVGGALVAAYALEPTPPDLSSLAPPPAAPIEAAGLTPAGAARAAAMAATAAAAAAAANASPSPAPTAPPSATKAPPVAWAVHTKHWAPVDAAAGLKAAGMTSQELAHINPVPPPLPSRSKMSPKAKAPATGAGDAATAEPSGDAAPPPAEPSS